MIVGKVNTKIIACVRSTTGVVPTLARFPPNCYALKLWMATLKRKIGLFSVKSVAITITEKRLSICCLKRLGKRTSTTKTMRKGLELTLI